MSGEVCLCMPQVECPVHPGTTPEVDAALVEALLPALPPLFDRTEPQEWMRDSAAHLAAVLEPYVQQRVAKALEGAAVAVEERADEHYAPGGCYYRHQQGETDECNGCAAYLTGREAARIVREAKP